MQYADTDHSIHEVFGTISLIRDKLLDFFHTNHHDDGEDIQFYGYYADYDWVIFCWIFGCMIDLPNGLPMYCRDLKQMMDERKLNKAWKEKYCPDPEGEHNALVDAIWNAKLYNEIITS